jgi:hypothetical protein
MKAAVQYGLRRTKGMRKDIDYVDCDSDSLVDDRDWITPSHSEGYCKVSLTNSIGIYYRYVSHYLFFNVVLSFDSMGANAPKSLPSLFYGSIDMLEIWEKFAEESEDDSE